MEIALRCCGGSAAPPPVVTGWKCYQGFPGDAQIGIWKLVVDSLAQPDDDQSEQRIQALCAVHDLAPEQVVEAALSAQFLLGNALSAALPVEQFAADLTALSAGSTGGHEVILSRFEAIRVELQGLELLRTMTAHGKVLRDIEWRLDRVVSSSRGFRMEADVVFLTLVYEEAGTPGRITLQLGKEGIASLKNFLAAFTE